MRLEAMLVEDTPADMRAFVRDLPEAFRAAGCEGSLHQFTSFEDAMNAARDPSRRFDLILSDTYQGAHERRDAAVLEMVKLYRGARFCPLVVFSASAKPDELAEGAFLQWADKADARSIERAIERVLQVGIPQLARLVHEEIDRVGAEYIWEFLDVNWNELEQQGLVTNGALERLVRTRAAVRLMEQLPGQNGPEVHGLEYYIYPPLSSALSLGQVMRRKADHSDVRVVVTPHCYLTLQANATKPRAEYVRVVRAIPAISVLGEHRTAISGTQDPIKRAKKLASATTPPSRGDWSKPEGRYWFLPEFLAIPNSYCDFLQVDSLPYKTLAEEYEPLAALASPYAESLQACLKAFDGAVGVPTIVPASAASLLR